MPLEGNLAIKPSLLRRRARSLFKHLHEVADVTSVLLKHGWKAHGTSYTLNLCKKDVQTRAQALQELQRLGIKRRCVAIAGSDD